MTMQNQAVFEAALALPEGERTLLVERLLESLSPRSEELTDEELAAELDRRFVEYQQNPSAAIPWSEVNREG